MKDQKRILVCRIDRLGDVVLATPIIREIKKTYPDSFIGVLVNSYTEDILLNNPNIDIILTDDPENDPFWQQVRLIRKLKFNISLNLMPTERITYILFFSGIFHRIGVGTKLYQLLTFTKSVSRNKYIPLRHESDYCMDLARKIGVKSDSLEPEVFITEKEKEYFFDKYLKDIYEKFPRNEYKYICIHPGNSFSAPNLSIKKYNELIKSLIDKKVVLFITGGKDEIQLGNLIIANENIFNFINKLSLRELCILISLMNCVISSSTGPMHIAAGTKTPTISVFCPLTACSPTLWAPIGNRSAVILPEKIFCQSTCINDPHSCILDNGIEIFDILEQINNILNIK